MSRILIIEDEEAIADLEKDYLELSGFEVSIRNTGDEGLRTALAGEFDLIVLDLMLPGMDGFEIARTVRQKGIHTPILMLTSKSQLDDKVTGLDSGADDYLTKPFMTKELLARLRALTRRTLPLTADGTLTYGDIALDTGTLTLSCTANGQSVRLSEKEYRILEYFIANQGQILTREQLAVKIWGFENEAEYNNVEVYMSFTRKKLSYIEAQTKIKAVRGIGYELRCGNV